MPRGKRIKSIEVNALRHTDWRVNIPTSELRDFADDAERMPPTMRYPRDPSLDPQLVWNGKDEQDGDDLKVLAVPIYIQEKIQPQAIIDEVRRHAEAQAAPGDAPAQLDLFSDFNGIEFEDLIEFYQHEQHWSNRMILGDSLMVMTSLAEKEGLKGQVQMIYLDPPYGIKFGSNWQVSTRKRDVKDGREEDLVRQPEQVRAFRDTWEKGIHSYLSYLRDRLVLARELLLESGSIFIQIGDENVHLVRSLLDEVFGSENFCASIVIRKTGGFASELLPSPVDYLLWYAKSKKQVKYRQLYREKVGGLEGAGVYTKVMAPDCSISRRMTPDEAINPQLVENGWRVYRLSSLTSQGFGQTTTITFSFRGKSYHPGSNSHWKATPNGMVRLAQSNRIDITGSSIGYIRYVNDFPAYTIDSIWEDTGTGSFTDPKIYVVQTGNKIIERCILMTTDPGDLVLDPTMGSGTTAYVAEQWGRRWITVDTSRVALALARTRLMSARYPFYLLADSEEGAKKEMEVAAVMQQPRRYAHDVKQGFVYDRVPHIMLRDIANNEQIDVIHEQWQPYLEERREWLNQTLGQAWEEWEVPRELSNDDAEVQRVLAEYWQARRERHLADQRQLADQLGEHVRDGAVNQQRMAVVPQHQVAHRLRLPGERPQQAEERVDP